MVTARIQKRDRRIYLSEAIESTATSLAQRKGVLNHFCTDSCCLLQLFHWIRQHAISIGVPHCVKQQVSVHPQIRLYKHRSLGMPSSSYVRHQSTQLPHWWFHSPTWLSCEWKQRHRFQFWKSLHSLPHMLLWLFSSNWDEVSQTSNTVHRATSCEWLWEGFPWLYQLQLQ